MCGEYFLLFQFHTHAKTSKVQWGICSSTFPVNHEHVHALSLFRSAISRPQTDSDRNSCPIKNIRLFHPEELILLGRKESRNETNGIRVTFLLWDILEKTNLSM
jgi:hypothetical protein